MPTPIETVYEWNELKNMLKEFDYRIYQVQFGIDQPEGFIVIFSDPTGRDLAITTHNEKIQKAIIRFGR